MRRENYIHLFVVLLIARSGLTKTCQNKCKSDIRRLNREQSEFSNHFGKITAGIGGISWFLRFDTLGDCWKGEVVCTDETVLEYMNFNMKKILRQYCSRDASDVQWVDYAFPKGKMTQLSPLLIDSTTIRNTGNGLATSSKTFTREIGLESNFQHEFGVGLKVGAEFTVGIPLIAEGTISTEVSTDYRHTWGETKRHTTTISITQSYDVPPGSSVKLSGKVTRGTMNIPYTMCLKDGQVNGGTWAGTDVWDREFIIKPITKK